MHVDYLLVASLTETKALTNSNGLATMLMLAKQVSLELAVRVLTLVLHWCPAPKRHAYMRSLEKNAALLTSRGRITGAEVSSITASSRAIGV